MAHDVDGCGRVILPRAVLIATAAHGKHHWDPQITTHVIGGIHLTRLLCFVYSIYVISWIR